MSAPIGGLIRVAVSVSASGDNTLVAGVAGYQIAVREFALVPAGAVNATIKSGASTNLTGAMPLGGSLAGLTGDYSPADHFLTNAGDPLVLNLSAAVAVNGYLIYSLYGA